MSLLMDALKKAEKEKKEAAKRKTGEAPVLDTGEYSQDDSGSFSNTDSHEIPVNLDTSEFPMQLEPLNANATEEGQVDNTLSSEIPIENTAEHPISSGQQENTREENFSNTESLELNLTDNNEAGFENTEEIQTSLAEFELQQENDRNNFDDLPADDTIEDQGFLSDSLEDALPFEETLDSVTASQLLQDIGQFEGQPTPVAANTVFQASRTSQWGNKLKVVSIVVLLLLVVGISGLFIHYKITPEATDIPSPLVAKGVELQKQVLLPEMLAKPQQDSEQGSGETVYIETEGTVSSATEVNDSDVVVSADTETMTSDIEDIALSSIEQATSEEIASTGSEVTDIDSTATMSQPDESMPVQSSDSGFEYAVSEVEEVVIEPVLTQHVSPAMIKISRIQKNKPEVEINEQAYAAYQRSDFATASSLYKDSLQKVPDNRNALMGLAAINMRQNQPEAAYALYQKILKLNPKDRDAKLAIINLQNSHNIANNESLLKLLLKENPDSSDMFFSLGNLYAKQGRWPDAQSAFFEAYSRRSDNAGYAMNLAVSLDRMGQSKAALNYYNKALELADSQTASFNTASVLARIKALNEKDI